MDTRKHYSDEEAEKLARYLHHQAGQGNPQEYEIRIDNLTTVPRTADPKKFFNYREFIRDDSAELTVLIYKGASRVSDKHVLVFSDKPAAQPLPTFEQRLESALEQERAETLRKYELDKLKEITAQQKRKIKKQRRKIKGLKQAVAAAGSESAGLAKVLKDLAASPSVKGILTPKTENDGSGAADLGALPDEAVIGYLKEYREKLGEQTFQELLGTTLVMAQQPELIAQVRAFITDQNNAA